MACTIQNLNPLSPDHLRDPYPLYEILRSHSPVYWSEELQAWFVTRHDDVAACFRDPRLSADRTKFFAHQVPGMNPDIVKDFVYYAGLQMAMKDGAEHLRLRRHANPSFTPQVLELWRPAIRQTMEMLVDRVQPRGWVDLVTEISYQLPPLIIAQIFGIPVQDQELFQKWSASLADYASPPVGTDMVALAQRANKAMVEFGDYLARIIEERRQAPGGDVISRLIHIQDEGGMTAEELVANALLMVFGGHITTTDQISNMVHALLTHPEQLQKLREDPGLVKSTVEESLRFSPAMPFHFRIVIEPMELRGQKLPPGSTVFLGMAAANRDPEVFTDPNRFDITRDSSQKLMTFAFGPHQCLGAGLARRELETALQVLLERLPGLRLHEEQSPQHKCNSLLFRSFTSLPVRWEDRGRDGP